jgi:hypothetical protein
MKHILCCVLFCLFMFHAAQAHANLVSGTVTTGSITVGGQSDQYFTGNSGQNVILSTYAGYHATITIYAPGGLWGSGVDRINGALNSSGTWHVVIKGQLSTDSGSYSLYYVQGGGGVSGGALASGTTLNATQPENGLTSYQFTGTTNQGMLIDVAASYSAYIIVYNPDGSLFGSAVNRFVGTLGHTGTYSVVIEGYLYTDNGAYSLYYVIGGGGVSGGKLTSGLAVNATQPVNGLTSYQFTGTANQGILLNVNASYTAYIIVYNPDGSHAGTATNRFDGTLGYTGTYTVVIEGYQTTDSGPYTLYYVKGADNVSEGTLVNTILRNGTLPANGLTSYQLPGAHSSTLSITTSASYSRYIIVYNPDGSHAGSATNTYSGTMGYDGQYTVVVEGVNTTDTGGYSITATVSPAPAAPAASDATQVVTCQSCLDGGAGGGADADPGVEPAEPSDSPGDNLVASVSGLQTFSTNAGNAVGNPINFDVGYKQQVQTDYSAGGLIFSRIYRSDSTWTNNTLAPSGGITLPARSASSAPTPPLQTARAPP